MNPFFFGASARPLYGVYHPPRESRDPPSAVLLCYPMGIEYMRAHRAFRQLTNLLVRAGVHVLRFDYFGTGDSAGDGRDGTLAQWREDIETAFEELKANAGVERAGLAGLRLGGTLAAQFATDRSDVDRLVLWDPIINGRDYLGELRRHVEFTGGSPNGDTTVWPPGDAGIGGFPVTETLRAELAVLDLEAWCPRPDMTVALVVSEERASDRAAFEAWQATGANVTYRCAPSENRWAEGDAFGSALIPQEIIQAVVEVVVSEEFR